MTIGPSPRTGWRKLTVFARVSLLLVDSVDFFVRRPGLQIPPRRRRRRWLTPTGRPAVIEECYVCVPRPDILVNLRSVTVRLMSEGETIPTRRSS
jgi:hypothetical protein